MLLRGANEYQMSHNLVSPQFSTDDLSSVTAQCRRNGWLIKILLMCGDQF